METRGVTNELNELYGGESREVIEGAAKMYGLCCERNRAFGVTAENSSEMIVVATACTHTSDCREWVELCLTLAPHVKQITSEARSFGRPHLWAGHTHRSGLF